MSVPRPVPLLSILIPTKDRYETLLPVVEAIASGIPDDRLEIVVCDNSPTPNREAVDRLANLGGRICYSHHAEPVSIVENTNRGIELCRGEYICFIGDDDLVSPYIVEIVAWLKARGADCLIYPAARYWWTSVHFARESRYQRPGVFWLPVNRSGDISSYESAVELGRVLEKGGVAYMNLPRLYHGIASRAALERIRRTFGSYVPGSSPDMALCIGLALTNERYLSIEYPVTVFGVSRNSGGGATAARTHYGRIEDQKHMPADLLDKWDPRLPQIFSEQIIYPQTIYEIASLQRRDLRVSYSTLYSSLVAYEPYILPHLWPVLRRYFLDRPSQIPVVMFRTLQRLAGRARRAFKIATGVAMPFELHTFADVAEVMRFMDQFPPPLGATDPANDRRL